MGKRFGALLVSVMLLAGQLGTTVSAQREQPGQTGGTIGETGATVLDSGEPKGAGTITVTAFDGLDDAVKYQTIPAGTKLDDLPLPVTLGASGYTVADGTEPVSEPITITGVTWEPDSPWDESAGQGSYAFTPVLPAGYALADKVELPEIDVLVGGVNATLATQTGVLTVEFNNNGSGGTDIDNNDMKDAIDAALAALPVGSYKTITTIKLTGGAMEITDYNWEYLIDHYYQSSGWDSLTALDLSGMTRLTAIRNDTNSMTNLLIKLKTLTLPDNITEIGTYAFYDCKNLALQTLPDGVTKIGDDAFFGCKGITLSELPSGVTQIGINAFRNCTGITLNKLPSGVTRIGRSAFEGCTGITLNELPDGITQIGQYAFSGCKRITLNELPSGVTLIGYRAFSGCTGITLNELPGGVTLIGDYAFSGCTGITLNALPGGVEQIGYRAFNGCSGLNEIIMEPTDAPTLGKYAFDGINPSPTFYVPEGGRGYDSDGWEKLNRVKYSPVTSISLPATLELRPNGSGTLTVTITPDDASYKEIIWESSAPGIATVDQDGNVTAVSIGTATITATSQQGNKTATCTVTVKTDPSGNGNGGGKGNGGSGSDNSNSNDPIITAPQTPKPNTPTLAVIELPVTVEDGTAVGKPDDGRTASAITKAQGGANAKTNGIAVQYDAKTAQTYGGFSITIQRATLDRLIAAKVKYAALNTAIVDLTLDLAALKEIQKQTTGDITLTAARETGLAGDALAAVGSRPAYRLTVTYTGADSKAAAVTNFGAGRVTVGLAYKPAAEQTGSLFLVYSADGKGAEWLYQSGYDRTNGNVIGSTGHFSVYGVGYKPAPAFTDTVNHWAKADIDFAASRGLLAGTTDTTFGPESAVTHGELLAALDKLTGRASGKSANPDAAITREQTALIIKQYAAKWRYTLPVARKAEIFADKGQITGSMKSAVQAVQQAGIMSCKGNRRFGPKDTATRAEAAAILRRFAEIITDPANPGGWGQNDAGKWLYYENNKPVTGWKKIDGTWYYFFPDGAMAVNTKIDGYEIGPDGARKEKED